MAEKRRITVFPNGWKLSGRAMVMPPTWDEFCGKVSELFKLPRNTLKVFLASSAEIEDADVVSNEDVLFVSGGEPFRQPRTKVSDNTLGFLTVVVIEGRKLEAMDVGGTSDPYCVVKLGRQSHKTKTISKSLDPFWDQTFVFEVRDKLETQSVVIDMFDHDFMMRDDFMGQVRFDFSRDLLPLDGWFPLQKRSEKDKVSGDLRLGITWDGRPGAGGYTPPTVMPASPPSLPPEEAKITTSPLQDKRSGSKQLTLRPPGELDTVLAKDGGASTSKSATSSPVQSPYHKRSVSQPAPVTKKVSGAVLACTSTVRDILADGLSKTNKESAEAYGFLHVQVIGARNLRGRDTTGYSDPYCVLELGKQKVQTVPVEQNNDPVWNATFEFDLYDAHESLELWANLWDYDTIKWHDFLGKVMIPVNKLVNGEERDEWYELTTKEGKTPARSLGELHVKTVYVEIPRIFGMDIKDVMARSTEEGRIIPTLVEAATTWLRTHGLDEEGLFRKAGDKNAIEARRKLVDFGTIEFSETDDPHLVAGVFKMYIRMLPEPLLTFDLYQPFSEARQMVDEGARTKQYKFLLGQMIPAHYALAKHLSLFFNEVSKHADKNRMNAANLGTVFGPVYLRPKEEQPTSDVMAVAVATTLATTMIQKASTLFES